MESWEEEGNWEVKEGVKDRVNLLKSVSGGSNVVQKRKKRRKRLTLATIPQRENRLGLKSLVKQCGNLPLQIRVPAVRLWEEEFSTGSVKERRNAAWRKNKNKIWRTYPSLRKTLGSLPVTVCAGAQNGCAASVAHATSWIWSISFRQPSLLYIYRLKIQEPASCSFFWGCWVGLLKIYIQRTRLGFLIYLLIFVFG